jgi:hypothetical protein
MAQPPLEEAQEVKADATAITMIKIRIVFLIFVVFKIETINCLAERNWYQVIQPEKMSFQWSVGT